MNKSRKMFLVLCILLLLGISYTANASTYFVVGDFSGGPVSLTCPSYDDDFVLTSTWRTWQFNWKVENTSLTTFTDVKMILPFTWGVISGIGLEAFDWVNSDQEWINDNVVGDDTTQNLFVRVNSVPLDDTASPSTSSPDSFIQMSDTDIPNSYIFSGATATVDPTDSLPAWDIDTALIPYEIQYFTTYIQLERSSSPAFGAFYIEPKIVATPVPTTILLFSSGLLGLVGIRRFRNRG